jgi:VIT1/CCC1 family predicted Fe2+/Mn2+ transporter
MGRADLQKMQAGTMDPSGRSLTQAGHIFGVVGTVLVVVPAFLTMALVALYFLAILVLGIAGVTLGA